MRKKYLVPLADPFVGVEEANAVRETIKFGQLREGEKVRQFEKKTARYLGVKHAVATSSGTTALHVALACLGVKEGDEVILPSFTCSPPLSMSLLVGATPVFADIENETYNIDPQSVEKLITEKVKVVIPINYAGHPAKLDVLEEITEKHGLFLLNDAAEALGATYNKKNVTSFGEIGILSFSPNKTITTGEGGMVVTNDDELAEKARILKDYGQKQRFHNVEIGSNYHITEMQAAMGLVQLRKIDKILRLKRKNAKILTEKLSDLERLIPPRELPGSTHCYCLYSVRVAGASRSAVMRELEKSRVQNRIYFPPLHRTPLMEKYKFRADDLKNTERVASTILSLPSSPKLTMAQIEYVSSVLHKALEQT